MPITFKIEGRLDSLSIVQGWEGCKPGRRTGALRRNKSKDAAQANFQARFPQKNSRVNLPLEIASKLQVGTVYEIQCTIIEKEGDTNV